MYCLFSNALIKVLKVLFRVSKYLHSVRFIYFLFQVIYKLNDRLGNYDYVTFRNNEFCG